MSIGLNQVLVGSAALLGIGAFAVVARRSLLVTLFGVQFMLLAGSIAFVAFGNFSDTSSFTAVHRNIASTMAIFVGAVALAQLGIGLAMAAILYRERRSFAVDGDRG